MTTAQLLELMQRMLLWLGIGLLATPFLVAASGVAWGIRWGLERAGFTRLFRLRRLRRLYRHSVRWPGQAYAAVRGRLQGQESHASISIVIDERLRHLKNTMLATRDAVQKACRGLEALGGAKGPVEVIADVQALQRSTQEVAALGGEIDDTVLKAYEERTRATTNLWMGLLFGLVFAIGNGALLGQFFRNLISVFIFGFPLAYALAVIIVVAEMGLGWLVAYYSGEGRERYTLYRWVVVLAVMLIGLMEAVIFGLLSYNFEFDMPLFDTTPWLRYWLAPFGVVFVVATSGTGYAIHQSMEERGKHRSVLKLGRDVRMANRFVQSLPLRWDKIGRNAREAESAIDAYFAALGGKDGELRGAIDHIKSERQQMVKALADSAIDDWKQVAEGLGGDRRRDAAINVGLTALTVAAAVGYGWALQGLLRQAVGSTFRLPEAVIWAIAIFVTIALLAIGQLPFRRLQHVDPGGGRVHPTRQGPAELGVAAGVGALVSIGLLWAGIAAGGAGGFFLGLVFVAGGAAMVLLGYFLERSARGAMLTLSVTAALIPAAALLVAVLAVNLISGLLYAMVWTLIGILTFLGGLIDLIRAWWRRRQERMEGRRASSPPDGGPPPSRPGGSGGSGPSPGEQGSGGTQGGGRPGGRLHSAPIARRSSLGRPVRTKQ
jgi:hypothetical protein